MSDDRGHMEERQQLEQGIAALEAQRAILGDAVVDAAVAPIQEKLAALAAPEPEQQRKLVTILFMDIVGSTTMVRDLDPEENLAIMDTALERLSAPIVEYGGRVTRYMGDGFMALFGHPVAHENDPEAAVRAGLAIRDVAKAYATEVEEKWKISGFSVRVGINTGLAVVGGESEGQNTLAGAAVNLAARLESAAPVGGVLISESVYRQVRGFFDVEDHEPVEAKGFAEPVPVYVVSSLRPVDLFSTSRGVEGVQTRMVGRDAELRSLQEDFATLLHGGAARAVTIVGDAGVGKSRLLFEFERWLKGGEAAVLQLQERARQEMETLPFGLVRRMLWAHLRVLDTDGSENARSKMVEGLSARLGDEPDALAKSYAVGQLLGLDFGDEPSIREIAGEAQQLRVRAVAGLTEFLTVLATDRPLVILLEDIHWADDSSLELLEALMDGLGEQPVLFIFLARPSLFERRPNWAAGIAGHRQLPLQLLSAEQSLALVNQILQKVDALPDGLRETLIRNAGGNPFYIEELVKMLIDDGLLAVEEDGWRVVSDTQIRLHVPPTLTGVLQARLDRLPPEERLILQQASVIGEIFWDMLVDQLNAEHDSRAEVDVNDCLAHLSARELIFPRGQSAIVGLSEHIFKHSILRQVTYESVLLRLRRAYHARIADWLIGVVGERESEVTAIIALHLEAAGDNGRAVEYLFRAGQTAVAISAFAEAIKHLSKGLEVLANLPDSPEKLRKESALNTTLSAARIATTGYGSQEG